MSPRAHASCRECAGRAKRERGSHHGWAADAPRRGATQVDDSMAGGKPSSALRRLCARLKIVATLKSGHNSADCPTTMTMRTTAILSTLSMLPIAGCHEAADVARWDTPTEPTAARTVEQPEEMALPAAEANVDIAATSVFIWDEFVEETPPPSATSFPLLDVGDLYFYVFFKNLDEGEHVAHLDIIGPDDDRYTTLSVSFEVSEEDLSPMGARVVMELPVAGTNISRFSLTGVWTARVMLDVVAGPPRHTATFELYEEPAE